jgi:endoglucanase
MKLNSLSLFLHTFTVIVYPLFAQSETEAIRINQLGYYPNGPKTAIVVEPDADHFYIVTSDLIDTVFTGYLSNLKYWTYSDEQIKQANFSELKTIGTFVVLVPDLGYSAPFDIKPRVHQELARAVTKAFYFQRMSIELTEEFAGKWKRPMGHPDTEVLVHASAATQERPEGTVISCPRGWYDAGDYNKYIVNSGISVYTLLSAYEHFPEYCREMNTHIPESGNNIPDVLDEALWNIRWMLTMQDPYDGGVYHKCTHANFSGMVMPHQATAPRYVVQKSTPAALNFTAVMAQTSRILREFESELPGLADSCLTAALYAWHWARKNPDVYYRQNVNNQVYLPQITTGEYGDWNDNDEFKWAAAELTVTTRQDSFLTAVDAHFNEGLSLPNWNSVATLAYYTLAHHRRHLIPAVDTTALKTRLIQYADQIKSELSNSAYGVMITQFPWGSNAIAANQSIAMIEAFEMTADSSYLHAAIANLDYLLGRNATTYCFVSGQGDKPPLFFHHRPSEADGIDDPVPGLLAGGPNPSQEDNCPGYPSDLPARSYLDNVCSYASNEICINWNAPLAYVANAVEAIYASGGIPNTIQVSLTAPFENNYFLLSDSIPLSAEASIDQGLIKRVEYYAGQMKIGESESAPYAINWKSDRPGIFRFRAKAIGSTGDFQYSRPTEVIVSNPDAAGRLLFVVGSPDLNSGDHAVFGFLVQNDYLVTIQDDTDSAAFQIEDKDAILVSSTISFPASIKSQLLNTGVPLISWEITLFDDFGWTGKRNNSDFGRMTGNSVQIVEDSHPAAAGLAGTVQITRNDEELVWGLPNENAQIIAVHQDHTDRAAVFVYETGVIMNNMGVANARKVGFCFSDESPAAFTEAGWKLFLQALKWAIAGESLAVKSDETPIPETGSLIQNYPNPFNSTTKIRYTVPADAKVTLIILNIRGQEIIRLVNADQCSGSYETVWQGEDAEGLKVPSGLYICRIQIISPQKVIRERKMILIQ